VKRFFLVMFGLLLVAFCAGWFLGPVQDAVADAMGWQLETPDAQIGTRSVGGPRRQIGGMDLNILLNAANAVIGFVGLVLTFKGGRARG